MSRVSNHQLWIKIHRYLGLATLAFLFLSALSGSFLCFDKAIDAALNPDLFSAPATGPAIDPVRAVEQFEQSHPEVTVTSFPLRLAKGRTIEAAVTSRDWGRLLGYDQAFLDPHSGQLVGTRKTGPGWDRQHIVEGVFEFHYTLLGGTWGRWLMGIVALGWLLGNIVGAYLTLPLTKPFWRKWKPMWTIDWSARLRRLLLDLHRASGLWLFAGVLVLSVTSVCMNFFDEAFAPAVEAISPSLPSPFDKPAPARPAATAIRFADARTAAIANAHARGLGWLPAKQSYLPDRNLFGVMFTPSGFETYRGLGPITLYLDGTNGHLVYADDPYRDSAGRKASRALYPLHSGEMIGPIGVGIIFLLGLASAEMCVTGLYTWWKKRRSRIAQSRKVQSKGMA